MIRAIATRRTVNRVAVTGIFLALAYGLYALPFADGVAKVIEWSGLHPIAGPIIYVVSVVIATVVFVPGSGSMMIAGFLFGLLHGFLYAAIAVAAGAQCAFLVGRFGARHWVEKQVAKNDRIQAIEKGLTEEAFFIVVLTRLSLVIPFNVLNYAYGLTSVTARTHLIATTVGMLPAVGLYVYLGTLARDLGQILSGEATPSDLGYWILATGITAIVVLTWAIHRAASRVLARHLPTMEVEDAK
ncbi:MAG: TVP38/TMEM64 family protein [Woeseiaceae bacterium]